MTTAAAPEAAMLDKFSMNTAAVSTAAAAPAAADSSCRWRVQQRHVLLLLVLLAAAFLGQAQGAYTPCTIKLDSGAASGLFVGGLHSGVVFASGIAKTWGSRTNGALGDGVTSGNTATPQQAIGITNAKAAMASNDQTCWLLSTGSLMCSGLNRQSTTNGILGTSIYTSFESKPALVTAISGVKMIPKTMGNYFYCVVKEVAAGSDGVYCIGINSAGQLGQGVTGYVTGTGSRIFKNQFYKVQGLPTGEILSISVGQLHTCVVMKTSGDVWCWGDNRFGAIGIGPLTTSGPWNATTARKVSLPDAATQVTCGNGFTCALLSGSQNGRVYCWGVNTNLQLGWFTGTPSLSNGHTNCRNSVTCFMVDRPTIPVRFTNNNATVLSGVTYISAGLAQSCALGANGTTCWGNSQTTLALVNPAGTGTFLAPRNSYIPSGGVSILSIALNPGTSHRHICVLRSDNAVDCWGSNTASQCGAAASANKARYSVVSGLDCSWANCTQPADSPPTSPVSGTSWSCPSVAAGDYCYAECAKGYEALLGAPYATQCIKGPTFGQVQEYDTVNTTSGGPCTPKRCVGNPLNTGITAVAHGTWNCSSYTAHLDSCTSSCADGFAAKDASNVAATAPVSSCNLGDWKSISRTAFCKPTASFAKTIYYRITGKASRYPGLATTLMQNSGSDFATSYEKINTDAGTATGYTAGDTTVWIHSVTSSSRRRDLLDSDPNTAVVLGFGVVTDPGNTVATSQQQTTTEDLAHTLHLSWRSPGLYISLSDESGAVLDTPVAMLGCLDLPDAISNGNWPSSCAGQPDGRTCTAICGTGFVGKVVSTCQEFNWTVASGSCQRKGSSFCPIDNCDTQNPGACAVVAGLWRCSKCEAPWVPSKKKTDCVCSAGYYPVSDGSCRPCREGYYCPQGQQTTENTEQKCPGKLTSKVGAKGLGDCVNPAGYYYMRKSLTVARALPCPEDTYSKGFDKAPNCRSCPSGFKTDPENTAGSHTSAAVCVAPPGYYVNGETVRLCPIGSYQDQYAYVTECKSCEETLGKGVATPRTGAVSVNQCRVAAAGYMLLESGGKAVWTVGGGGVSTAPKVTGARECPQGYVCLGGGPLAAENQVITVKDASGTTFTLSNKAPGIPQICPNGLTTKEEGAYSFEQCVAPPGKWGDFDTAGGPKDCPSGTYKAEWARASKPAEGCVPCGSGLWLSERNYRLAYTDLYGQVLKQELVRGTTDSCYIQRGMGTERTLTTNALNAVICPKNTYGTIGDELNGKKYGQVHTPCTTCPSNMITGYNNGPEEQIDRVVYFINDAAGLTSTALLSGSYSEPTANVTVADGSSVATGSGSGYYHVKACTNPGGSGYYNGIGQKCPQGYYNAPGNNNPCSQCATGLTTGANSTQASEESCDTLAAGYTINSLTDKSPAPCPIGTYSTGGAALASITTKYLQEQLCKACPLGLSTLETGATNTTGCNVCAPGFGGANVSACNIEALSSPLAKAAAVCQRGTYGPASRSTTECMQCPEATRTFSYAWPTDSVDVFYPTVTSPPQAKSIHDCLADFAQVVDGSFFLDLDVSMLEAQTTEDGLPILGLQACVAECAASSLCAAATYDYYIAQEGQLNADGTDKKDNTTCMLWKPGTTGSIDGGGMALKTMSAYTLSQSVAKDVGSGWYSMYPGANAAAAVPERIKVSSPAVDTVQDCLDLCTQENMCAGVIIGNYTAVAFACTMIMASREPGNSKRTLVKAQFASQYSPGCPAGQKVSADHTTCEACPAGEYWDEPTNLGYECKICRSPNIVSPDRTRCLAAFTSCPAGSVRNSNKPDECMACPTGTYKAYNDTGGVARDCENCTYRVSSDRTKCHREAPCSRGLEWAEAAPGHCVSCEKTGYYKDWADVNSTSPTKCAECPSIGTKKFQNTLASSESCVNNCDGGYMYDDTDTASRIDPTKCVACPWPRVKAGPAGTACLGICDVDNPIEANRTTPNSDRTACVRPVVCPSGHKFDVAFPEDISKCTPCDLGYANSDGVWLCVFSPTNGNVTQCVGLDDNGDQLTYYNSSSYSSNFQQQDPNNLDSCQACPWPFYKIANDFTTSLCRLQANATMGGTCGSMGALDSGYGLSSNVGRDVGNFWRTNNNCYQQCGVDSYWDDVTRTCVACLNSGQVNGTARPHGNIGTNGASLLSCTTCVNGQVSYQGYCVTPVTCPFNAEYSTTRPLSVEECTPCVAGKQNPTGVGKCY